MKRPWASVISDKCLLCVIDFFFSLSIHWNCAIFMQCIYSCLRWRKSFLMSCKLHSSSVPLLTRTEWFDKKLPLEQTNLNTWMVKGFHLNETEWVFYASSCTKWNMHIYNTKTHCLVNKNMENTRPIRSLQRFVFYLFHWKFNLIKIRRKTTSNCTI